MQEIMRKESEGGRKGRREEGREGKREGEREARREARRIKSPHIIINCIIVDLSEFVDIVMQLQLLQNTIHHTHQNLLVPAQPPEREREGERESESGNLTVSVKTQLVLKKAAATNLS